jgi:hypothetical protein
VRDLDCKKYADSGLRPRPLTLHHAAQLQQVEVADPFELGGLCDDDLEETHPAIVEVEGLQHNPRGNEVFLVHYLIRSLTSIFVLPACEDLREKQRHPRR